jgi:tyrosyl-tRNA synthetase
VRRLPPRRAAAQIKQLMRSALVLMYACLGRVAGLTARATVRRRPHVLRAVATDADLEKALSAKSPFLREFAARGYLAQCTDIEGLDEKLTEGRVSAYLGFDATADSLHVGSLLQIMILRLLQKHNHRPVVLVGGGTTKVGDPSGKDESRQLLDEATIQANIDGISSVFDKFIEFGADKAILVNNADWLDSLGYVEFLRTVGAQVTVNRMLSFESVKQRLGREQPLSFLEFNYMLLQAYDFLELYRREGVELQLGGSDQWGNIVSGVELTRRVEQGKVIGLTAPLLQTADGRKMGKTAAGAVWLSPDKLSPFDYWQFWRNSADADVIRFMKLFTELELSEIEEMAGQLANESGPTYVNSLKRRLADECTTLLHGADCLPAIHETADSLFKNKGGNLADLPRVEVAEDSITVVDALIAAEFAKSKGEARRLIKGGGARVDGVKVEDVEQEVALAGAEVKLSSGKKKHALLVAK